MKKLGLLVMPLMAISFLASCNNGGGGDKLHFSLSSDQPITVKDKTATVNVDWTPTEHSIKFDSFTFKPKQGEVDEITFDKESEARPMPVTITFKEDITTDITGTLSFAYEDVTAKTKGESSLSVTIPKPEPEPTTKRWYEYEDWWKYCSNGNPVNEAKPEEIGKEVDVIVNGIVHKVRLIDIEHRNAEDEDPEAHCTFEFSNLIAGSDEYTVSTPWNDKEDEEGNVNNCNFPDSTLNDLLNNNDDCIFKALPTGLQEKIRTVTKKVATTSSYTVTPYQTKLFPLAFCEIADNEGEDEGLIYQYYKDHSDIQYRKKTATDGITSESEFKYWLRSPYTTHVDDAAYGIDGYTGDLIDSIDTFISMEFDVAPAFCI